MTEPHYARVGRATGPLRPRLPSSAVTKEQAMSLQSLTARRRRSKSATQSASRCTLSSLTTNPNLTSRSLAVARRLVPQLRELPPRLRSDLRPRPVLRLHRRRLVPAIRRLVRSSSHAHSRWPAARGCCSDSLRGRDGVEGAEGGEWRRRQPACSLLT